MSKSISISIIGAGISGLTLGRCLLQNYGIKATIFEKARKSANRNNYGITLNASSYRPLLKVLRLDEDTFEKRVAVDAGIGGTGRLLGTEEKVRVNRSRLEEMLADGLDVRWETEVTEIKTKSQGNAVVLEVGGEEKQSHIVVGADGPHSKVRQTFAPDVGFKILPFAVYNGKRIVKHDEWEAKRINALLEAKVLEQRVGNAIFQVSLNDCDKDGISVSYTYSRAANSMGSDELFRPDRPKHAAREMPEALFKEVQALREQLEEPFKTVFDAEAMRKDRLLNWLMRTARVDLGSLNKAAEEGVVFLGDSVHPEPILGSMGACEAIDDAIRLAAVLSDGSRKSLKTYYTERYSTWEKSLAESEVRIDGMHKGSKPSL